MLLIALAASVLAAPANKPTEEEDKSEKSEHEKYEPDVIPEYGCPEGTFLSCCASGIPVSSALGAATTDCEAALEPEEGGGDGVSTGSCDTGLYATCCTTAVDVSDTSLDPIVDVPVLRRNNRCSTLTRLVSEQLL